MAQNLGRLYTVVISQVTNYYQPQLHYKDDYVPAKNYHHHLRVCLVSSHRPSENGIPYYCH